MPSLIARAFFPHLIGYLVTFSFFGILGGLVTRDADYVVMAGIFLIAWAAGPALFEFQQRTDSERFLRTLPVTHAEIVSARFLSVLLLLALCWLVLLVMSLTLPATAEETGICLKFFCAAVAWSLLAAGASHLWVAYNGPSILLGVLLNVALIAVVVPFFVAHARPGDSFDTRDTFFVSLVTAAPWWIQVLLPVLGAWAFLALMKLAAASKPRPELA